ncbi:hypothetical protein INR49_004196, partial [Caranx melampygus]
KIAPNHEPLPEPGGTTTRRRGFRRHRIRHRYALRKSTFFEASARQHTSLREPARRERPFRDSASGSEEVEPLQDAGLAAVRQLLPLTFVLYLKQL